jgi:hypothetical protein
VHAGVPATPRRLTTSGERGICLLDWYTGLRQRVASGAATAATARALSPVPAASAAACAGETKGHHCACLRFVAGFVVAGVRK